MNDFYEMDEDEITLYRNEWIINQALNQGHALGLSKEEVYFNLAKHLLLIKNKVVQDEINKMQMQTTPFSFVTRKGVDL